MSVNRYNPSSTEHGLKEDSANGVVVFYSDYQKLEEENERLKDVREEVSYLIEIEYLKAESDKYKRQLDQIQGEVE